MRAYGSAAVVNGRSGATASVPVLELANDPRSWGGALRDVAAHRGVLWALARSDFSVRYKRAAFGLLWAVALPLLQATVLAVVLSNFVPYRGDGPNFAAYVLTGVLPWAYFATALTSGGTAVVDGSTVASKVWFPRLLLPLVHPIAGLVGLAVSIAVMVLAMPVLDVDLGARIVLLVPATALLIAFTATLTALFSALHVYFRDVRYLIQALVLLWFYATPIFYETRLLRRAGPWLDANPMTGVMALFRNATVGHPDAILRPVVVAVLATVVLALLTVETYRRLDRVLVDRL